MSPKSIVLNDGEMCGPMRGFVEIAIGSTIRYISFNPQGDRETLSAPTELGREIEQISPLGERNQPHFWYLHMD